MKYLSGLARHMEKLMPRMTGSPLTWGPDGEDRYLAGTTCGECFAQLLGEYVKAELKAKKPEPHVQAEASRQAAIASLKAEFDRHACSPERLAQVAKDGESKTTGPAWIDRNAKVH